MVIWLRADRTLPAVSQACVGVHGDVVPRAAFGALLEIEEGYARLAADREAALEAAREDAAHIVAAATQEANAILTGARCEYDEAAARGYREGEERALADWTERLAASGAAQRRAQLKMRERIANIVTVAVEQIVQVQQPDKLFERALSAVDRIAEGATWLRIAVSPSDYEQARATFERLAARWRESGRPFPMSVVADRRLAPGSCLCESDFGAIDASLATQMRAMRLAVSRALRQSVGEVEAAVAALDEASQARVDDAPADLADTAAAHAPEGQ